VPFRGFPEPMEIVARAVVFIIAITVHEFMHAWTANALGDPTARQEGRITLNPVAHFDPLGFLFALLLIFGLAPIAWGKPVPVNPYRLRGGRRGMAVVAAAGPLSNLVLAAVGAAPLWAATGERYDAIMLTFISAMILWNVALFAFNLLPIPPLDGFNILVGIVPDYWVPRLEPIRQYAFIILLLVMFLPIPLLSWILSPIQQAVIGLLVPG
jgi:Zn-dependent protease